MSKISNFDDPKLKAQARATRKKNDDLKREAINQTGRARARREPGDARNVLDSIASFCSACITAYGLDTAGDGSVKAAIEACTAPPCHLYPWRGGTFHAEEVLEERK